MTAPHRPRSRGWIAATLWVLLSVPFLLPGCTFYSDLKTATRDMDFSLTRPDSHLKRKIALTTFENHTSFQQEDLLTLVQSTFRTSMSKECSSALILGPGDPDLPAELKKPVLIRPGVPDNMAIARAGRGIGANTVITGAILDISSKQERHGIFWFRKAKQFAQFTVAVAAYDMETGAKILDESAEDEVEIEELDFDEMNNQKQIKSEEFSEALRKAVEDLAERACDKLQESPWKGFVTDAGSVVRISAGRWAGFKPGAVFDVLAPGRAVEGFEGQQFFLPGHKVGQIEITAVDAQSAAAKQISGEPVQPGFILRVPDR